MDEQSLNVKEKINNILEGVIKIKQERENNFNEFKNTMNNLILYFEEIKLLDLFVYFCENKKENVIMPISSYIDKNNLLSITLRDAGQIIDFNINNNNFARFFRKKGYIIFDDNDNIDYSLIKLDTNNNITKDIIANKLFIEIKNKMSLFQNISNNEFELRKQVDNKKEENIIENKNKKNNKHYLLINNKKEKHFEDEDILLFVYTIIFFSFMITGLYILSNMR